jgi:hypothetical protein
MYTYVHSRIFFWFAGETKMATRGGRISLPLAVGVDCGHSRLPGVDHGHPSGRIFFFWLVHWRQIWPLRVAGSLPLTVGVDRGHPQWPNLSSFFFSRQVATGSGASVAGGGRLVAVSGSVYRRRWEWIIYLVA